MKSKGGQKLTAKIAGIWSFKISNPNKTNGQTGRWPFKSLLLGKMALLRLSFLKGSTYQLSSKNNLFKWKKGSDPTCLLCNDKPQILKHVLSSWKWKIHLEAQQSIGRVGQIYKELYEIRTNYFNPEICFREWQNIRWL